MPLINNKHFVTVKEATALGKWKSSYSIYRLIRLGKVDSIRIESKLFIEKDSLLDYLDTGIAFVYKGFDKSGERTSVLSEKALATIEAKSKQQKERVNKVKKNMALSGYVMSSDLREKYKISKSRFSRLIKLYNIKAMCSSLGSRFPFYKQEDIRNMVETEEHLKGDTMQTVDAFVEETCLPEEDTVAKNIVKFDGSNTEWVPLSTVAKKLKLTNGQISRVAKKKLHLDLTRKYPEGDTDVRQKAKKVKHVRNKDIGKLLDYFKEDSTAEGRAAIEELVVVREKGYVTVSEASTLTGCPKTKIYDMKNRKVIDAISTAIGWFVHLEEVQQQFDAANKVEVPIVNEETIPKEVTVENHEIEEDSRQVQEPPKTQRKSFEQLKQDLPLAASSSNTSKTEGTLKVQLLGSLVTIKKGYYDDPADCHKGISDVGKKEIKINCKDKTIMFDVALAELTRQFCWLSGYRSHQMLKRNDICHLTSAFVTALLRENGDDILSTLRAWCS